MIAVVLALSGYVGMRYATSGKPVDEGSAATGPQVTSGPGAATNGPTTGPGGGGRRAPAASAPSAESTIPIPERTRGSDPATSGSPAPGGVPEDLGEWKCSEKRWAVGHPATGTACHALGTRVRVKGSLSAVSGVEADIQVVVENADSGQTVAGPFSCENKQFTDAAGRHECGPQDVGPGSRAVPRGHQMDLPRQHRAGGIRRRRRVQLVGVAGFVQEHTTVRRASAVPEIVLHQADDAIGLWERTELAHGGQLPPPFWAFAWAGGQAVARYLLDHPEVVRNRRVLDLAAGGGVVAIAAALAGPAR